MRATSLGNSVIVERVMLAVQPMGQGWIIFTGPLCACHGTHPDTGVVDVFDSLLSPQRRWPRPQNALQGLWGGRTASATDPL